MKHALTFPLRLLAFWLLFFAAFRLWFVLWFRSEWSPDEPGTVWMSFWHALPLDFSMAGYLIVLPVLFGFIGGALSLLNFTRRRHEGGPHSSLLTRFISGFNFLLISVLVFIFGANVFIYEEWHTLLNNRAAEYLSTPRALLDSMSLGFKIGAVLLYFGGVWIFWRIYRWMVGSSRELQIFTSRSPSEGGSNFKLQTLLLLPVWLGIFVLMIRGLGVMPINESAVYYSPHPFDNHAATNTAWHLAHSQMEVRSTTNHFRFMSNELAAEQVNQLMTRAAHYNDFRGGQHFQNRLDTTPLNVVFLIMESMTAQVIDELGGEKIVCPSLSSLIYRSILFENCYGSGYRTDQGLVSVLAGYPAQPDQSIVLLSDKAAKLNSVPKILSEKGYSTAFFYGGELTFANIGVWLSEQRFDKIVSEKDFPKADKTQRWGVDDHRLLQRSLLEINQLKPPFFATAMTLSLHPPYDVPYQSRWQGTDIRSKFLNSAAFADWAIGQFFKTAEQQPWYANTLFVLVADHGSASIGDIGQDNPKARRVPLIFFSPAMDRFWKNTRADIFCNHHDIPATVMRMLGEQDNEALRKAFPWSRDLWQWHGVRSNPDSSIARFQDGFAYYSNENGLGWLNKQGKGFYSFTDQQWHTFQNDKPQDNPKPSSPMWTLLDGFRTSQEDFLREKGIYDFAERRWGWPGAFQDNYKVLSEDPELARQLDSISQQDAKAYLQVLYDDFLDK